MTPGAYHTVFLGLGSNLDAPKQQLQRAISALQQLPTSELLAVSPFYRSAPVGPAGQPDYCNAVVKMRTQLSSLALLDATQAIEHAQGRVRAERWSARTLDIDLLLVDQLQQQCERLTLPHPYLHHRNFVVYPLWDIAPDLVLPDGQRLEDLRMKLGETGLEQIPH
jgi:2-amino-4-hydroxy-6-hydroxymethyldihydropteridine diphosphokinase